MFLDLFFPRHCTICGRTLDEDENVLCIKCNIGLPRLDNRVSDDGEYEYARMFYNLKVAPAKVFALMRYMPDNNAATIIHDLKYGRKQMLGEPLGTMVAQEAGKEFFSGIDCMVPVPLTVGRMLWRGFNQSELIANGISKETGVPLLTCAVLRKHFNCSQTELSDPERLLNVLGAFRVIEPDVVKGKHVLVVDDIITTGATASEVMKELINAGAKEVSVIALAKAR